MLRIYQHSRAKDLGAYFHNDFVGAGVNSHQPRTFWFGKGAEFLGLSGEATLKDFRQLSNNILPGTKKRLTQRTRPDRRVAYDCVFSAPKSVSLLALVADDLRVIDAHIAAVLYALKYLERLARCRVRRNGADYDRQTGNMIAVCFLHYTSRGENPQLHTHVVVFNATHDTDEDKWKALQPGEIYTQSRLLTGIYRSALVRELNRLGYAIKRTRKGFEIVGVGKDIRNLFSKRHAEIDRIEKSLGKSENPALREAIARCSRHPKDVGESSDDLRNQWLAQMTPVQVAQLHAVRAAATQPVKPKKISAGTALKQAGQHLFERSSVVWVHELVAEALGVSHGTHDVDEIYGELTKKDGNFIVKDEMVTTRRGAIKEALAIAFVHDGRGKYPLLAPNFIPASTLSREQEQALSSLLSCPDRVMGLIGPAGAGKTTVAVEIAKAVTAQGTRFLACAPTSTAVNVLSHVGFANAITLKRLLLTGKRDKSFFGAVIFLDEAGLVSLSDMGELFDLARRHQCRIILSGDPSQHKSVEAGDALRLLATQARLYCAELNAFNRQTNEDYREVVRNLWGGHTGTAMDKLHSLKWIHELPGEKRYEHIAQEYADTRKRHKSAIAVTATLRESELVSAAIRSALKAEGLISQDDFMFDVLRPAHWTEARRRQLGYYESGDVIVFHCASKYHPRGEQLTVVDVAGKHLLVEKSDGRRIQFNPATCAKCFSVFSRHPISISVGDEIQFLANGVSDNGVLLTNGDTAEVTTVSSTGGIRLADGRTVGSRYRQFALAYATTSQRAQAKTVDEVLLAIDAQSAFAAATTETFYVAASRGRERCQIFTDDSHLLSEAFRRSGERLTAFELFSDLGNTGPRTRHRN